MIRSATANWKGTGKEGKGIMSSASKVLDNAQYSYGTRFENGIGTNPEELVGAAHAGCFSMKLSFILTAANFPPENIDTKCDITFEGGVVSKSALHVTAKVPGITNEKFQELAADAKANCPISKLLNTEITLEAVLA